MRAADSHPLGLCAGEIAAAAGGRLVSGKPGQRFSGLAIDSRRIAPGTLFVALPGARVDGHDFVAQALAAGAGGVLVARAEAAASARPQQTVIAADDTLAALQAMARDWRARLGATVLGIAGSNGKTTTKEVVASVLGARGRTFATPGNENSQIGAPIAILAAPLDTEFLVLELGTSAPGELGRLGALARPDLAIVTAAFAEHLEFLGSIAGVIEAETELLDHLPPRALALVGSAEVGLVDAARRRGGVRVETVGRRAEDAWRLGAVDLERAGTRFELGEPAGGRVSAGDGGSNAGRDASARRTWRLPLLGEPAAWAGAFAVAAARALGLTDEEIVRGLAAARPAAHRLRALTHPSRALFALDDCYNSNPASARAAIEAAVTLGAVGDRLILVLGDMLELGEASEEAHRELGLDVARLAPQAELLAVGPAAEEAARAARDRGVRAVEHLPDAEQASARVREILADGRPTTLLVKASRGIGLERILDDLFG